MKTIIHEAGIGELFSAHSITGAAATAAHMKEMAVSDILKIADWSSDNVFKVGQQKEAWDPYWTLLPENESSQLYSLWLCLWDDHHGLL